MWLFTVLGGIAVIFQLVLLREFTFSLAKNELALIVAAGFWLAGSSAGSIFGIRKQIIRPWLVPLAVSFSFFLCITAVHLAKTVTGSNYYEAAGIGFVFIAALVIIVPLSFFLGYSFCLFSRIYLARGVSEENIFGRFFAYEALGFLLGGAAFTFIFSAYTNPLIFSCLPLLFLFFPGFTGKKRVSLAAAIIALSLLGYLLFPSLLHKEFKGAHILEMRGSGYGPVIVAEQFGVRSLYVNGSLAATSEDALFNEEFVHTSFSAIPGARQVLYIGPSFSGQIEEMLAYPLEKIDVLEINPVLSSLGRKSGLKDRRVRFIVDDPRLFLEKSGSTYDCLLMSLPPPSSLALNRYYTFEFFSLVKEKLSPGGVFCFCLPSKEDILSPRFLRFNSCIVNTVKKVFSHVLLVPADSMLVISSRSGPIETGELKKAFASSGIEPEFFSLAHLNIMLCGGRRVYMDKMLDKNVPLNRDFSPRAFLYYLLLEQAMFYPDLHIDVAATGRAVCYGIAAVVLIFLAAILFGRKMPVLGDTAFTGFCSFGMVSLLMVLFQVFSGALFWKMGLLIGVFMAGLTAGTFMMNHLLARLPFSRQMLLWFFSAWCVYAAGFYFLIRLMPFLPFREMFFYGGAMICGMLTGAVYPLASWCLITAGKDSLRIAPALYSADLAGAFFGNICFVLLLIPFLGLNAALGVLGLIVFLLSILHGREILKKR